MFSVNIFQWIFLRIYVTCLPMQFILLYSCLLLKLYDNLLLTLHEATWDCYVYYFRLSSLINTAGNDVVSINKLSISWHSFCWGHLLLCLYSLFLTYTNIWVRVLGRSFNYLVAPEIYYMQVLVWIFNVTFCVSISPFCSRTGIQLQFVLEAFNRFGVLIPARGIAYTNITHIVIPLSLC